jgi:hypothetical protein
MACSATNVGIQFDGPHHYLTDLKAGKPSLQRIDGKTRMRNRILERLGWTIHVVDSFEWDKVGGGRGAKLDFVRKKVREFGLLA